MLTNISQVEFIRDRNKLFSLLAAIAESGQPHALDLETTGLIPEVSKVRTLNIYGPCTPKPVVVDLFKCGVDFHDVATYVARSCTWYVFNILFEGRWFQWYSEDSPELFDVGLMSKARLGGRPLSLKMMVQRDLKEERTKEQQMSDWTLPELTHEQIIYAAQDAVDTYQLGEMWARELTEHNCWEGFYTFNDAWEGTAAMEDYGMLIDVPYHQTLIHMWQLRLKTAERVLRKYTPESLIPNLRSKQQVGKFIASVLDRDSLTTWPQTEKNGQLKIDRKILRQASFRAPYPFSRWLAALMVFNRADKYLGTYGEKLVNIQERAGRIRTRFNIAQAATGRYSSSEPNLQNIPRNPLVRRSFVATAGCILVLADYSGIELRVLAELSDDEQLRHDVIYGNVHAESALLTNPHFDRERFFKALDDKDPRAKEARNRAKGFSFQLTYGASPPALAVVLRCTDEEATAFVHKWAERYPNAYNYRFKMAEYMGRDGFLPINGQRWVYVRREDRSIPVASNYPIQGTAADVMYRAITYTNDWFEHEAPSYVAGGLVASIHDELLSETRDDEKIAKEVLAAQIACMTEAWSATFPGSSTDNLLESAIGYSWAAKP